MKKSALFFTGLLTGLLILGVGCKSTASQPTAVNVPAAPEGDVRPITLNPDGAVPQVITIAVGDTIEFRNSDLKPHWPASNPHPVHTDYSEFDPKKPLAPGDVWRFKFLKAGAWKFHDHLAGRDLKFSGTITVK